MSFEDGEDSVGKVVRRLSSQWPQSQAGQREQDEETECAGGLHCGISREGGEHFRTTVNDTDLEICMRVLAVVSKNAAELDFYVIFQRRSVSSGEDHAGWQHVHTGYRGGKMRCKWFFQIFGPTAFLLVPVLCCLSSAVVACDETQKVADEQLVADLSESLVRGNGLQLRGHLEDLAGRPRSVLGKLQAWHHESPRESERRLPLAMACLVCGDVSNELVSELSLGVCSRDPDVTAVIAVALQQWSGPLLVPIRRHLADAAASISSRLQGACLLSMWENCEADPESLWRRPETSVFVVEQLCSVGEMHLSAFSNLLRPQAAYWVPEACRRILSADPGADRNLAAPLSAHVEVAIPRLRRVLERRAPYWPDELELPVFPDADAGLQQQIEAGAGRLADRWAFCLDIRFSRLQPLLESLRGSGYRPIRLRPQNGKAEQDPRMCVVWVRDSRRWELVFGQQPQDLPTPRMNASRNGLVPVDICLVSGQGPYSGWMSLWEEPEAIGKQRRIVTGVTQTELLDWEDQFYFAESEREVDFPNVKSLFSYSGESGQRLYCAVFSSAGLTTMVNTTVASADIGGTPSLFDITWCEAVADQPADLISRFVQDAAETEPWPGNEASDVSSRFFRTEALFHTGNSERILEELAELTEEEYREDLTDSDLVRLRCLAFGQLGRMEEAMLLQHQFAQGTPTLVERDCLGISLLACWSDFPSMQKLLTEARARCETGMDYYALASSTALAGRLLKQRDAVRESAILQTEAIALLKQAVTVESPFSDLNQLMANGDLMDLHQSEGFQQIFQQLSRNSRFSVVEHYEESERTVDSCLLIASTADELLLAQANNAYEGWRPVGIVVNNAEEPIFGLLLQQPTLSLQRNVELPRQAAAAHVLLRLGQTDAVLPFLDDNSNLAIRSFLLQRLQRYAVDSRILRNILAKERSAGIRQAIVQGFGELAVGKLIPAAELNSVRAVLLKLYAQDNDPGVHSAAGWSLAQLDVREGIIISSQPSDSRQLEGGRGWYKTAEAGITMAILPTEQRRPRIRRLAVSTCEITEEQFQLSMDNALSDGAFSPGTARQPAAVTWHEAARFCNWLSEQEGIPEHQWCYVQDQSAGNEMRSKKSYNSLEGYRLPTREEWRGAFLAGADASLSDIPSLLQDYAWYSETAGDKSDVANVGLLRPNRYGLFDMEGNRAEWCHDGGGKTGSERVVAGGDYSTTFIFTYWPAPESQVDPGFRVVRRSRGFDSSR